MKTWMITAACLVVLGLLLFAAVMTANQWDFTKLSTAKSETNTYPVDEEFTNISIQTETADISFAPSGDGMCRVVCCETENAKHTVSVQNGTLTVRVVDERKWYEYIGIMLNPQTITVYLPENAYAALQIQAGTGRIEIPESFQFQSIDISASTGSIQCYASASERMNIETTTGDIRVENASVGLLNLSVTTGDVTAASVHCGGDITIGVKTGRTKLTDVTCENFTSTGSTGEICLKNVIAAEKLSIERSTGTVKFEGSDASEIFVKTSTGDIRGSLLSDKVFIAKTSTGDVRVPNSVTGGRCELTTGTGDIIIETA